MNPNQLAQLYAVVAMTQNSVIGSHNQLPWHLPDDLKHFKALTVNHAVLMGRKTYQSIGRPLPHRENLILTQDLKFSAPGCHILHSFPAALDYAKTLGKPLFVIGGAEIFELFMPYMQIIYLTLIDANIEGDVYFPPINPSEWESIETEHHAIDAQHAYAFSFITLKRLS